MKCLFPLTLLVAVGLIGSVAAYNSSRTYNNTTQGQYERGITDLLNPYCREDRKCTVMVSFIASICSVPSQSSTCQSDCKFLLSQMWDKVLTTSKPSITDLKEFVPDDCAPAGNGSNSHGQSQSRGECRLHRGSEIVDGNQDAAQASMEAGTCREQGSNGRNYTMQGCDVWIDTCRTSNGEIIGICLETGYLFKNYRNCP